MEATQGVFTTQDVIDALRTKNGPKLAAMGAHIHCQLVASAAERLATYVESVQLAHEAGRLHEAWSLSLAVEAAAGEAATAALALRTLISREQDAARVREVAA